MKEIEIKLQTEEDGRCSTQCTLFYLGIDCANKAENHYCCKDLETAFSNNHYLGWQIYRSKPSKKCLMFNTRGETKKFKLAENLRDKERDAE